MSFLSGLANHWKMDESNGQRADSHAYQGLFSQGTILSASGVLYNDAASFPSGNNYLFTNNHKATGNMSISMWVKLNHRTNCTLLKKIDHVTRSGYRIGFENSPNGFVYHLTDNTDLGAAISFSGGIQTGQWNHLLCWFDVSNNSLHLKFNNSGENESIVPVGTTNNVVNAPIIIGSGFSGTIGPLVMWNRILSTGEQIQLYSTGVGVPYSGYTYGGAYAKPY